jgi:dethiobiotin synthetase
VSAAGGEVLASGARGAPTEARPGNGGGARAALRGLFVTGTGTGVGKTVVAGCIAAALGRGGYGVAAFKPVVTGTDEVPDGDWPPDHVLLASATGGTPRSVAPHTFGPPVSPHLAAELAGASYSLGALAAAAREAAAGADLLVAEGVGGLLVPLTPEHTVRDLAVELGLPVVIAASPGLGTINHTLLTLEAARSAGLEVRAVVLGPWPGGAGEMERSNRDTIARLGEVPVSILRRVTAGRPDLLAAAGLELPVRDWIAD